MDVFHLKSSLYASTVVQYIPHIFAKILDSRSYFKMHSPESDAYLSYPEPNECSVSTSSIYILTPYSHRGAVSKKQENL